MDAEAIADVAARTFPLACPPQLPAADVRAFIDEHLTAVDFRRYLRDRDRDVHVAEVAGAVVGYTMTVHGEPSDPDVAAAVTTRPTAELSKCYVLPEHHGAGVARALVAATAARALERGAGSLWLGVNQQNERAQRFYRRCEFARAGTKTFTVGTFRADDYVMTRTLAVT
nr:GNAT family N-acetyltransferase [Occultella glacieicola]